MIQREHRNSPAVLSLRDLRKKFDCVCGSKENIEACYNAL